MIRLLSSLLMVVFLTSCASVTPPRSAPSSTPSLSWGERVKMLSRLSQWTINGKIAVQTNDQSGSATVDWQQHANQYTLSLTGPLGSGGFKLKGSPGGVILTTADGKQFTSSSAEQLLADNWGFHLPVSNLRYWVRGLPAPGMGANTQFDASHRLSTLRQDGWLIQFQNYKMVGSMELPEKMTAESKALKVKMVIYQWQV